MVRKDAWDHQLAVHNVQNSSRSRGETRKDTLITVVERKPKTQTEESGVLRPEKPGANMQARKRTEQETSGKLAANEISFRAQGGKDDNDRESVYRGCAALGRPRWPNAQHRGGH